MPFFANSREGPSAKLRKKAVGDQVVDNNTYTPDAVLNHVGNSSLQHKQSTESLTSVKSLPSFAALAQLHQPSTILTQLTRTTRSLLNMSNEPPAVVNIGKPRFVKRNDSPIYRFPSQKEQLLIEGAEKLVILEGDVIPGPGVKPKERTPEPEVVREEPKKVLKVVNLPDPNIEPAFEEIFRVPTLPRKPPPLAANRLVPLRRESIPITDAAQVIPSPTPSPLEISAQARRAFPNYRGVAAFRFGGSIPGPSPAPKDSQPISGTLARANTTKLPAIRILPTSPLSREFHPNIPLSPPVVLPTHLSASHSWQNQCQEFLREPSPAPETKNSLTDRLNVKRIQKQNIELHNRMQALEENALSDNRMLLSRIIALEKVNSTTQQTKMNNGSIITQVSNQIETELATLREQNILLKNANGTLGARVIDLELQNENLTNNAEFVEFYVKAKEEAEINAESNSRKALALLTTINALETQNSLDRKRNRDEKDLMQQQVKVEQYKYIKETHTLSERIAVQEAECAKHLEDLRLKEEEKSTALKERDNLQKELKVLWVEIGDITKMTEAGNSNKITDLESQLAEANTRQANGTIVREKLEREIEVLWTEIRDMHEKQSLMIAKAAQVIPPTEVPVTGESNDSSATSSDQSTPPQSPQISVSIEPSPLPGMLMRPLTPITSQVARPGTPLPGRKALNQPDSTKPSHARPGTPVPHREILNRPDIMKPSHVRPGTPIPQTEVLNQPDFIKSSHARPDPPVPHRVAPNQSDLVKFSRTRSRIPVPKGEIISQPDITNTSQIVFASLRRKDSGTSLRFRRNAIAKDEVPKIKSPKSPPESPIPNVVPVRHGYMGMRGQKGQRPPSRSWKPPGQSRGV